MPDKPLWLNRLPEALRQLANSAEPWIDRPALESLLGVGRRRAQQLLAPVAKRRVGASLVAHRDDVMAHLKQIAAGQEAYYEERRRKHLWEHLAQARREWVRQPPVLVEASQAEMRRVAVHDLDGLPEGVDLAPGSITVRFRDPDEALRKLMALAMAISRNRHAFDQRVALPSA
ncbi:MAG: hypothetical protein ACLQU1_10655 [Bryobacteraceae bacterium]